MPRSRSRAALFSVVALGAFLLLGVGSALGAEEGGSTPTDPIVVPETEAPTSNPTTTPSEPSSGSSGGSSSPAPTSTPSGSTTTGTTTTHTSAPASSGGSGPKSAPTQVNHGISGGSGGSSPSGGSNSGGSGGGETTSAAPTGSSFSPTTTTEAGGSGGGADNAAATTAARATSVAKVKKPQHEQPAAQPDPAPETGSLSDADAVTKPDKQAPFWAPLGGKDSLPYKLLILMVVVVGLAILILQFTNPQRLRYYRARLFGMPEPSIPVRPRRRPAVAARPRPLRTAERAAQPSSLASRRAQRRKAA